VDDRAGVDVQLDDAVVVAEHPAGTDRDQRGQRRDEDSPGESEVPERPADRAALDRDRARDEHDRQQRVLDPRQGRQGGEYDERELCAAARARERADGRVERRQHQRIRERIGEHEGDEEEIRRGDGERRGHERNAGAEPEAPAQQIDRHRRERHHERVLRLRQPVGEHRVVEEPERRGGQRLEQSGEVRRRAPDQRPAVLGERPRERRVDVLVGEVERRRVRERDDETDQEAGADDAGEHEPRRDRRDPRQPERQSQRLGPRGPEIDRHGLLIGKREPSLNRVTTAALRGRAVGAVRALGRHEEAAMRAFETLVARAFGEQLAVEGLLAVRTDGCLVLHLAHRTRK
jgi:hypothetical protein